MDLLYNFIPDWCNWYWIFFVNFHTSVVSVWWSKPHFWLIWNRYTRDEIVIAFLYDAGITWGPYPAGFSIASSPSPAGLELPHVPTKHVQRTNEKRVYEFRLITQASKQVPVWLPMLKVTRMNNSCIVSRTTTSWCICVHLAKAHVSFIWSSMWTFMYLDPIDTTPVLIHP